MSNKLTYTNIPRDNLQLECLLNGNGVNTGLAGGDATMTNTAWVDAEKGYVQEVGDFNGSSSYGTVTNYSAINFTDSSSFSLEAWVKPGTTPASNMVVSNKQSATTNEFFYTLFYQATGLYRFSIGKQAVSQDNVDGTTLPTIGEWAHLVGTFDGTDLKIYINGQLENTTTKTTSTANTSIGTYNIGRQYNTSSYFDGNIGLNRVYNTTLSDSEIHNLYTEGQRRLGNNPSYPALLNGTVAYYDFKGDANDIVGGNNLTNVGTPTYTTDHLGIASSAVSLDGSTDGLTLGTGISTGTSFSISMPVYRTATTDALQFLLDSNAGRMVWAARTTSVETGDFVSYRNGTAWLSFGYTLPLNTWAYLTLVTIGTSASLYVNGIKQGASLTVPSVSLGGSLGIGVRNPTIGSTAQFFPGRIGYTLIQDKALSAGEALTLYQLTSKDYIYPFSKSSTLSLQDGLVMHLDGDGNDLSGNGNSGTPTAVTKVRKNQSDGGDYNGTSSVINCGNILYDLTTVSVSTWLKYDDTGINRVLYSADSSPADFTSVNYGMTVNTNSIIFQVSDGIGGTTTSYTGVVGKLYHVTGTYDGSNIRLYINGVLKSTAAHTGNNGKITPLNIANWSGQTTQYFNGHIYTPKIRNRALSAKEVEAEYHLGYLA